MRLRAPILLCLYPLAGLRCKENGGLLLKWSWKRGDCPLIRAILFPSNARGALTSHKQRCQALGGEKRAVLPQASGPYFVYTSLFPT